MTLKKHYLYRIAYNADNKTLRGRTCIFMGYIQHPLDIRRAVVIIGEEQWEVAPSALIKF